jgi:hypothetical protein
MVLLLNKLNNVCGKPVRLLKMRQMTAFFIYLQGALPGQTYDLPPLAWYRLPL